MTTLYMVAGERSGDRHGAGLLEEMEAIEQGIKVHGLGGVELRSMASGVEDWVEEAGVVGLVEVLKKYGWFRRKFAATLSEIAALKPDAVILIDYPGFNLRLAKALKLAGYPGRIIYYISPQVWAWHRGRIPKMAAILDLMICIFPFEKSLYEGCGLRTEFGGHPLVEYHRKRISGVPRDPLLVGLFPGSRRREIVRHMRPLLDAARRMQAANPALRFVVSAASEQLAALMDVEVRAADIPGLSIETGTVYSLMERVSCGAVASGTATLEAAIYGLPHCLIYKVNTGTYVAGRLLVKVPWLGIVNILAGREIVRELIQSRCTGSDIAAELTRLRGEDAAALTDELRTVVDGLSGDGAYRRAAAFALKMIHAEAVAGSR